MNMHTVLNVALNQAELYTRILRRAGYHVLEANSGIEALRLVREASPQLVVLDAALSNMDGLEVCQRIKAHRSTSKIMVLLVSASPVPWFDKVIGLEGGADVYLTEPFEPEELVAWAKSLLRLADREMQNRELLAKQKQLEDQLRSLNAELEERVRQRTAALEQANATILKEFSERKRLEAQLQQAEKMESIGLLAGGIAHDFNNILNIIKGYTSLLEEHRCNGEDLKEISKVFYEAVERGSSTVDQLLTLASRTELQLKPLDLNEIIDHMARLLGRTFPKNIDISLQPASKLPKTVADHNHISQALLNLCVNARDAMPSGGRLILTTGVVNGKQLRDHHFDAADNEYVFIEVGDTGEGMEEVIRSRVFEPFFTTKGPGKGTGLGLSMVYGMVKNHDGFIDVESEPRQGARFRIYLPTAATAAKTC